ncbi:hypothetical protein PENSPDRAFT_695044 [Peniophora sp. CONT]|nr:hypothetical protein PENSPDRAFT_695044 [Peniophora sp. CONT]
MDSRHPSVDAHEPAQDVTDATVGGDQTQKPDGEAVPHGPGQTTDAAEFNTPSRDVEPNDTLTNKVDPEVFRADVQQQLAMLEEEKNWVRTPKDGWLKMGVDDITAGKFARSSIRCQINAKAYYDEGLAEAIVVDETDSEEEIDEDMMQALYQAAMGKGEAQRVRLEKMKVSRAEAKAPPAQGEMMGGGDIFQEWATPAWAGVEVSWNTEKAVSKEELEELLNKKDSKSLPTRSYTSKNQAPADAVRAIPIPHYIINQHNNGCYVSVHWFTGEILNVIHDNGDTVTGCLVSLTTKVEFCFLKPEHPLLGKEEDLSPLAFTNAHERYMEFLLEI